MPDLLKLRYEAKKQPDAYKQDVLAQLRAFDARLELFKMNPEQEDVQFIELTNFLSQVAKYYPEDLGDFPQRVLDLLIDNSQSLQQDVRIDLFKCINLLFNGGMLKLVDPGAESDNLTKLFSLLALHDKQVRAGVQNLLLKQIPKQATDNSIINTFQTFVNSSSCSSLLQIKLLEILNELFYQQLLKSDNQSKRVVNIFAD